MATPKAKQWERWVAAFDNHGDAQDADAVAAFHDFCKDFKPAVRIHGGDCFDLRWLRRAATDDEKMEQVKADFEAGLDFVCKFKPTVFLQGNHDKRLWETLDSNAAQGAHRHLAGQWIDRLEVALGGSPIVMWCKRRGLYQHGSFRFAHGYAAGVNALRTMTTTYGNICMGHIHRDDSVSVQGVPSKRGYASGCLCDLNMEYTRGQIGALAHSHGWLYGWKSPSGDTVVMQPRLAEGRWICPTDL